MARMDLTPYVDRLGEELAAIADAVGEDVRAAAARLTPALGSAMRLTLLAALSAATDEITLDLAPGSVDLRLRGGDPQFVTPEQKQTVEAVAVDMWEPFIRTIEKQVPEADIVHDKFHVSKYLGEAVEF